MENLPEEVLLKMFKNLTGADLCNVVLVCKYFFKVGTDASLWTNVTINKKKFLSSSWEDVGTVFDIPRYKRSRLDLSFCHGISVLRMIQILRQSLNTDISDRDLSGLDLLRIPRGLLSQVVSRSTKANLNQCEGLRPSKLLALFTRCSESATLQHLHLEDVDLVSVPSELLNKTIQSLKTVSVLSCICREHNRCICCGICRWSEFSNQMRKMHQEALFNAIINSTTLETVNLSATSSANVCRLFVQASVDINLQYHCCC